MNDKPLISALANRIYNEDVSFRTRMMEIAAGLVDVIALGRGDPDFHTPPHIVAAAKTALDADQHHYTHPAGLPQLRSAIAASLQQDNQLYYSADEIIVTAGVQEAVMLCMLALINPGDEILVPSPRFTSYDDAVRLCGGIPVPVPTYERDNFALMPAEIAARISPRSKVLILASPNNPTGAVTPPAIIRDIAALAMQHNLVVISDEIYSKLIFDGSEHMSIASLPMMKTRAITLNGFSKSYAMTGWRVGYLAAPIEFIRSLIEPRHTLSINTSTPAQFAALAALTGPQDAVAEMRAAYAARRTYMMAALDDFGFTYGHPGGGFYIYTNVSRLGVSGPKFCETLLRDGRVLIFPGTLFGDEDDRYVRISLLQPMPRLEEAVVRMRQVIARHWVGT